MDSTFTDRTSNISARLARNKVAGHALMKRAGFPVPEQVTVATVEEAVQHARRIGYPIVVKPADLDGGRGVSAGLEDEPALRAAWARARAVSERTIVEKHIHGKDYRLGVFHGRLQWATYREPAGVTGDGVSTISQLIASANTDPRRGTRSWSSMRPLVVDAEAEEMLALQNIALADIPASGRHIRFRRASNISSGGIPASVLEAVHPDNARLAVEVARLFRLDFAGIDFITPDISQPWTEVGGGICEVNGQPQFSVASPWTAIKALECLLAGDGRIATAAVLGGHLPEATVAQVRMELAANGLDLLCCKDASKGGEVDSVLLDSTAGALLVHASAADWLAHGMPLDRVDLTVLLEPVDQQLIQSLGRVAMGKIIDATSMTNNHAHLAKELTDTLLKADRAHRLQT
jgi:cyanophycin synthetase